MPSRVLLAVSDSQLRRAATEALNAAQIQSVGADDGNTALGLLNALSSNIDDRTLHEVYAWPFAESVRAGVASVMCSYQMVNNSYACANSKLMNGILKDELGFQGFIQFSLRTRFVQTILRDLQLAPTFSKATTTKTRIDGTGRQRLRQ